MIHNKVDNLFKSNNPSEDIANKNILTKEIINVLELVIQYDKGQSIDMNSLIKSSELLAKTYLGEEPLDIKRSRAIREQEIVNINSSLSKKFQHIR